MLGLEIYSDPVCPWCFVGKSRLDKALAQSDQKVFDITWKPFQLNPDIPAEGMGRREYLETKFGGKEGAARAYQPLIDTISADGLEIHLDRIRRMPNSLDAHRLIRWAEIEQLNVERLVDALFIAFFRDGRDIGRPEELAAIAESCGMDRSLAIQLLQSDADKDYVRRSDYQARQMGISAVPQFIVGGRYAVAGAQPTMLWNKVIAEIQTGDGRKTAAI